MEGPADEEVLYSRPWVALGENFAALRVAQHVREHVAAERLVYRTNSVLGLCEAIEAGIGIGPLPCFIGDPRPALVRLSQPDPSFAAELWLLTHPDLRQAARIRAFLDFMAGEIARERRLIEGQRPERR